MNIRNIQVWGGVECTVNRIGDRYLDQIVASGHDRRLSDLDLIRELGITTIRFPVLWERTAPESVQSADWSWSDQRMTKMRDLRITPIVGLLHHGSGPRHTSLVDPSFPRRLATYARAVAERYPDVTMYTPVNEPLTTARFSCLYGLWYPHKTETYAFLDALLNQCRATVLAMREIRRVRPDALLVQTEDIGVISSTSRLRYQADFENLRRWLTFDILFGRLNRDHPLWQFCSWAGVEAGRLELFLDEPCPPDLIGINHYVTSNRYLDHRVELYPEHLWGGNGRDAYVDAEWIRIAGSPSFLLPELIQEVWHRYHRPIVITEAHLGCACVDEQAAWLGEFFRAALAARRRGVDIRAVTLWSLLGAFDWDSLLTCPRGNYEAGLFIVEDGQVRWGPNAHRIQRVLETGRLDDIAFTTHRGWWRRDERALYPAEPPEPEETSIPPAEEAAA